MLRPTEPQPTTESAVPKSSLPVLIVDDEPGILELLQSVLQEAGFTVLTASNGAAALYMIQREPVGLVLTDFMMPNVSGLSLAQQLRDNPQTAAIPLILMSAAAPQQTSDIFALVIHKPFAIDVIVNKVRALLPA